MKGFLIDGYSKGAVVLIVNTNHSPLWNKEENAKQSSSDISSTYSITTALQQSSQEGGPRSRKECAIISQASLHSTFSKLEGRNVTTFLAQLHTSEEKGNGDVSSY